MIKSMTAFASGERDSRAGRLSWELRSVNHRYLDVSMRLPEGFRAAENTFKGCLGHKLSRGKVEANLHVRPPESNGATEIAVNDAQIAALLAAQKKVIKLHHGIEQLSMADVLSWPGVVQQQALDFEALTAEATALLADVVDELAASRASEGAKLSAFISQRCDQVAGIVEQVSVRRDIVNGLTRERFMQRIAKLDLELDPQRLEQELVMQAQKLDVSEELDRLVVHVSELRELLKSEKAVGRRLDFLMQELNREANTLGSKSGDAETTRLSIDLKVLIEQMREQIQNIE